MFTVLIAPALPGEHGSQKPSQAVAQKGCVRMKPHRMGVRKGFSLVEMLAVMLILAVLAAVAVPLYMNTRRTAAARACKANINAIASAEAAYALRNGVYTNMATLVGGTPEGLSGTVTCPLVTSTAATAAYQITDNTTNA